jgi:hypothetical protein
MGIDTKYPQKNRPIGILVPDTDQGGCRFNPEPEFFVKFP